MNEIINNNSLETQEISALNNALDTAKKTDVNEAIKTIDNQKSKDGKEKIETNEGIIDLGEIDPNKRYTTIIDPSIFKNFDSFNSNEEVDIYKEKINNIKSSLSIYNNKTNINFIGGNNLNINTNKIEDIINNNNTEYKYISNTEYIDSILKQISNNKDNVINILNVTVTTDLILNILEKKIFTIHELRDKIDKKEFNILNLNGNNIGKNAFNRIVDEILINKSIDITDNSFILKKNQILTPEIANDLTLSENFKLLYIPFSNSLSLQVAEKLTRANNLKEIILESVNSLNRETAEQLAKIPNLKQLDLRALTSLSWETAEKLAQSKSIEGIELYGLKELTDNAAEKLAQSKSIKYLNLNGLTELSPKVAEQLAKIPNLKRLDLKGLTELSPKAKKELEKNKNLRVELHKGQMLPKNKGKKDSIIFI